MKFSLLDQGPFSGLQVWRVPVSRPPAAMPTPPGFLRCPHQRVTFSFPTQGCSSSRDYLAVQGPDKLTTEDFWTLVWEQDIHTILTLLPWQEMGEVRHCACCSLVELLVTAVMSAIHTNQTCCCAQVPHDVCWPLEGDSLCTKLLTIQCGTEKPASGWRCIQLKVKHVRLCGAVLGCWRGTG